jgi:hypothetical protein
VQRQPSLRVFPEGLGSITTMPRPTILTPAALARVPMLVNQGLSAAEIAEQMGCTVGTLRVKCSQLQISLRRGAGHGVKMRAQGEATRRGCEAPTRADVSPRMPKPGRRARHGAALQAHVELTLRVPRSTAEQLQHWAALRGLSDTALAAELLITIARDSLCDAVLDHG